LLATIYPNKTARLAWTMAGKPPSTLDDTAHTVSEPAIVFPGPVLARKGAFELREAVRGLRDALSSSDSANSSRRFRILTLGQTVEEPGFWQELPVEPAREDWLHRASVVVQPAFLENNPRALLRALSAGIAVIATPECGLENLPNLTIIPAGDLQALKEALRRVLHNR
jgi:glycosyltransferase involved in cell wall biosynthesis